MAKILYKKKVYEFEEKCMDEFGEYEWYFNVYLCFSKKGFTWQIKVPFMVTNQKRLRNCMNDVLEYIEECNPRYYRLKNKIFSKGLHNKLW